MSDSLLIRQKFLPKMERRDGRNQRTAAPRPNLELEGAIIVLEYNQIDRDALGPMSGAWRGSCPQDGGQQMSAMSHVYIAGDPSGRVKIGVTRNLGQRLSSLRTSSGLDLSLLRVVPGSSKVERWFHKRFAGRRQIGEWFSFEPDMLACTPPEEPGSVPTLVKRRDIRLTVKERVEQAAETADSLGITGRGRAMLLVQSLGDDEADELVSIIAEWTGQ